MDKVDFRKTLDAYQATRGQFRLVEVPEMGYLLVDGHGDPNSSQLFGDSIEALYPIAYALKFASKVELGRDYVVPPLEGLWWSDDMQAFTVARDKTLWSWTLMMFVPDWVGAEMYESAVARVASKSSPLRLGDVRFDLLSEGRSVQTLHVGSFDDEAPVLAAMHDEFIPRQGLTMTGKHHEIYLSDFRRVAPEKLRTILRQPVGPTGQQETSVRSGDWG